MYVHLYATGSKTARVGARVCVSPVFKVLRNGLLRYILHTCPKTRVQGATEWTASVHTSHMSKVVM